MRRAHSGASAAGASAVFADWIAGVRARRTFQPGGAHPEMGIRSALPALCRTGCDVSALARIFGRNADLAVIALVVGILLVLFAPIPAGLLDFLILLNV